MNPPLSLLAELPLQATKASFLKAAEQIAGDALQTPLLPYHGTGSRIRLKAENLQPWGSFKIRGGANALAAPTADMLRHGVATASAGNFAQGLAVAARRRGITTTVHVPETSAGVKLRAIEELGARVVRHSFADWWRIMSTRETGQADGVFVHPVSEPAVILGNGTIGLELVRQWPELDTVVVPFGGGGLICGIALALRALGVTARIVACEVETSTPLAAARAAGRPVRVDRHPSFVDGIGSHSVLEEMWPLVRELIDEVIVVSLTEVRSATRELALRNHLIVEGAGAAAVAAAASSRCRGHHIAAIASGGNIDPVHLAEILTNPD